MARPYTYTATDGETGSTDWTVIGARILQVATIASAIHLMEYADASRDGRSGTFRAVPQDSAPVLDLDWRPWRSREIGKRAG